MLPNHLLHPDHVIPSIKLIAALLKCAYQFVTQMLMEMHAVVGQMFILMLCVGNAGIQIAP